MCDILLKSSLHTKLGIPLTYVNDGKFCVNDACDDGLLYGLSLPVGVLTDAVYSSTYIPHLPPPLPPLPPLPPPLPPLLENTFLIVSFFFLSCTLPLSSSCNFGTGLLSLSVLSGDVARVNGARGLGGTLATCILLFLIVESDSLPESLGQPDVFVTRDLGLLCLPFVGLFFLFSFFGDSGCFERFGILRQRESSSLSFCFIDGLSSSLDDTLNRGLLLPDATGTGDTLLSASESLDLSRILLII